MSLFKCHALPALAAGALAGFWCQSAAAQLRLPTLNLPQLPLGAAAPDAAALGNGIAADLAAARSVRVRALVRAHRGELDTDRAGNAVVRGVVLALAPSEESLAAAVAAGFSIAADRTYAELGLRAVTLRAPPAYDTRAALALLHKIDPGGRYDYDHLFDAGGRLEPTSASSDTETRDGAAHTAAPVAARVGLIDGGIDAGHAVFAAALIHRWGCEDRAVPSDHGTAVASLLVGQSASFSGVLPHGEVYAADVYCGRPTGGAADTLVAALAWLVGQHVAVINVSLVGPSNLLLERAVESALQRGYIIVAAVGNDGPAAAPLYPAAYAGVVGVTGVDAHRRILLEACRGPQVSFAAPGADMKGASADGAYRALRGTSFAAPIVAGLLAMKSREPDPAQIGVHIAELALKAIDLGAPGRDAIFGYGLVGEKFRVPAAPHN